jgi:hypothetical protein
MELDELVIGKLKILEEKLDNILFELDSDYIVLDIQPKPDDSILSFIDKDLLVTVVPYVIPYLYLYLKVIFYI